MTNVIMETPIRKRLYQTGKRLGTTPVSCKIVAGISRIIKLKATSNNQNSQRQWRTIPTINTAINTKRATRKSVAGKGYRSVVDGVSMFV